MNKFFSKISTVLSSFAIVLMVLGSGPSAALAFTPPTVVRNFSASITPTASLASATQSYTLTVTNDPSSQNIIRSAAVVVPTGWSVANLVASTGWTVTDSGSTIELDKVGGPLQGLTPGESATVTFDGTAPAGAASSEWTATAFRGDHQTLAQFDITSSQPTVGVTVPPPPVYVTTQAADSITETDATLHGLNGDFGADQESFWVSTSTFDVSTPNIPANVYSTPVLPGVSSGAAFSDPLSLVTTNGIITGGVNANMPAITPATTYYFVAWSNVGGTWHHGDILTFTTLTHISAVSLPIHLSPADNSVRTTAAQTEIDWSTATDTNSLPLTYTYQAANDPSTNPDGSFVTPVYTSGPLSTPSIPTPNTPEGVYYWHVMASDGTDTSGWTTPWKITIDNSPAPCLTGTSTFDDFALGSVDGQNSWSATGPYDQAIVPNNYGYPTFGCKTLRVSDAIASGSFGDWIFAAPMTNAVGETAATTGGFSEGTRQNHFEATFDIASTQPTEQPGLHVSVSPDRGDGSRMSYLRFEDQADGIHVIFVDTPDATNPAAFPATDIATLTRSAPHTIKLTLDAIDGPSNDVVNVYIDGTLVHTGTSWENYYRFDSEASVEQSPRIIKTLIIQARGDSTPADAGKGFLFDNISMSSSALTGTIEVTKYSCPVGTTVTRAANGVGHPAPEGCAPLAGTTFGYVHGTQTDANSPYPELGQTFTVAGTTTASGVLDISDIPSAGRYLVAETDGSGHQLAASDVLGLYCTGDGDTSGANDNQELTFVPPGGTTHCVAYDATTTVPATGSLVVYKVVNGGPEDGNPSAFPLHLDGETSITSGATTTVSAGSHVVTEDTTSNYVGEFSGDCNNDGTVDVATSTTAVCTLTNTYQVVPTTATINIHKVTNPAGFNQDFTFDLISNSSSTQATSTVTANPTVDGGNTSIENVLPGNYNLVEEDTPLWGFTNAVCTYDGGEGSSVFHGENLAVEAGDVIDCTFTNTANGGGIHIVKKVLASDGSTPEVTDNTQFTVHVLGMDADTISASQDATHTGVLPGTYSINEDAKAGYDLVSITPDISEAEGTQFTVTNGTTTEIVVTNKQQASTTGSIQIVKHVLNSSNIDTVDSHSFSVTLNGTSTKSIAEGSSALYENLLPGTYTIAENPTEGYSTWLITPEDANSVSEGYQVNVTAGTTTVVVITNKQDASTDTGGNTGGSGGSGGQGQVTAFSTDGGTTGGSTGGQVLGASTDSPSGLTCQLLLTDYMRKGIKNDPSQVSKLQTFLDIDPGSKLPITGFFGNLTEAAVKAFQLKYAQDILGPWVSAGLYPNITTPTGYVYKTTQRWINHLTCPSSDLPVPKLP